MIVRMCRVRGSMADGRKVIFFIGTSRKVSPNRISHRMLTGTLDSNLVTWVEGIHPISSR
ncbi:hypothetical protein I7I51_05614 [Histoplasma capsulatum]|uniref:Uncharacterized protein n=1 Tax=Ajellomyces capsulatus TaxID=5037 RepID=A0A8A1M497_AJECA|nr:hypothetical protein I7I51_05614 [Histoplasma capsulatum]